MTINVYPIAYSSHKRKDGRIPIKVAVYAGGQTRYINTGLFISDANQLRDGVIVDHYDERGLNSALRKIINRINYAIDNIDYIDCLKASEILELVAPDERRKPQTLSAIYSEYISTARVKESTARLIGNVYRSIEKSLGKNFNLASLTFAHLMKYERSLRDAGNCNGTIRTKMAIFSKIVRYAEKARYVKFQRSPFADYKYPKERVRDAWLTTDEIRKLRDAELTGRPAVLRDYIMISYYLGGINAIDLMRINFRNVSKTRSLSYVRTKTKDLPKLNEKIAFIIPDEAWPLINRHMADDGFLGTPYQRYNNLHDFCAQSIAALRDMVGIQKLIYYSARKSFAQHAFELGIHPGVIDYILGHKVDKGGTSLYNYIFVTSEIATNAIRKVLDNLK